MTKKIFIHIAALSIIAMCALGCDAATNDSNDKTDSSITAPVVELPPSAGENPFRGKTFEDDGSFKHVYTFSSDGKTIAYYVLDTREGKKVQQKQYRCSVDADKKEVAWYLKKTTYGSEQLYSFEELVAYMKSGKLVEDYKASLREELDKGNITTDEFNEYSKSYKEWIDEEIAGSFSHIKNDFSAINRYKYKYNENEGTLDSVQQFEKSTAHFKYHKNGNSSSNELSIAYVSIYLPDSGSIEFRKDNDYIEFRSQSFSDGEIVFANEDDKNDTFIARYELTGSGNDTKMQLSFTYNGQTFNPTLDFEPSRIYLTEVK